MALYWKDSNKRIATVIIMLMVKRGMLQPEPVIVCTLIKKAAASARYAHEEIYVYVYPLRKSVSLGMVGRQLIGCYVALGSAEKIS